MEMEDSDKKALEIIKAEVEDNNKILRSLQRSERVRRWMSIIYWLIVIGLGFGAYYFTQPYIDELKEVYGSASERLKSIDINLPFVGGGDKKADEEKIPP
jgi:hypothetical protein